MRRIIHLFIFLFFFSAASAQLYETDNGHAEVHGKSTGPDYTGVSDELMGKVNFETGEVYFKLRLESLNTGNNKRNKHMRQTLNTGAFPYAEFHGNIISEFDLENPGPEDVQVRGTFSIHGQSREIEATAHLDPNEQSVDFNSSFPLLLSDYGMERPNLLFVKTEDQHMVEVRGTLKEMEMNVRNE